MQVGISGFIRGQKNLHGVLGYVLLYFIMKNHPNSITVLLIQASILGFQVCGLGFRVA